MRAVGESTRPFPPLRPPHRRVKRVMLCLWSFPMWTSSRSSWRRFRIIIRKMSSHRTLWRSLADRYAQKKPSPDDDPVTDFESGTHLIVSVSFGVFFGVRELGSNLSIGLESEHRALCSHAGCRCACSCQSAQPVRRDLASASASVVSADIAATPE